MNPKKTKFKIFKPSEADWKAFRRYQKVPVNQKLAWLDRYRSFYYELLKCNPDLRKKWEEERQKKITAKF